MSVLLLIRLHCKNAVRRMALRLQEVSEKLAFDKRKSVRDAALELKS